MIASDVPLMFLVETSLIRHALLHSAIPLFSDDILYIIDIKCYRKDPWLHAILILHIRILISF